MDTNLLYWADPIDQRDILDDTRQREQVHTLKTLRYLGDSGWVVYYPQDAFLGAFNAPTPAISNINNHALESAAALVAVLPLGVPTIGVPAEINHAIGLGKPVVIITDAMSTSWVVAGWDAFPNVLILPFDHDPQTVVDWLADQMVEAVTASAGQPLIFQSHHSEAKLPTRGHDDDAGYDLYTLEDTVIEPGEFADVPTGVAVDLPDGLWGMITGRSSTLRKRKLLVSTGIIDNGYTGVLFAGCQNLSTKPVVVLAGERVAQIILLPTSALGFTAQFGQTRTKLRGENGFGSTGR